MGWIGKIVGGTIGLFLGGPLGAIAGVALGHGLDVARDQHSGTTMRSPFHNPEQKAQLTFFVATFSMLAKLVKADKNISREEISTIETFMVHDLHLDFQSRQVASRIFQTALESNETFESLASQFYGQFRSNPQLLELLIDILIRVAAADGNITRNEEELILQAVRIFGFTADYYRVIKQRYSKAHDTAYAILGCSSDDSNETIKKKYKQLVFEHHPDTIASKGLPEEFVEYANKKFSEIQQAYETIRKERGF